MAGSLLGRDLNPGLLIEEHVGSGSFGSVYRVADRVLDRSLALKVLHPAHAQDSNTVIRLFREARVLARLSGNPHVPLIFRAGWIEDRPFVLLEYVKGKTLARVMEELFEEGAARSANKDPRSGVVRHRGRYYLMPSRTYVTDVLRQVTTALADMHEQGIIHRDIKASNVMIVSDRKYVSGLVKVLDFGLARTPAPSIGEDTASTAILGTLPYMAPELFEHHGPNEATDLYALGVLAFELACGFKPVEGATLAEIVTSHSSGKRKRLQDMGAHRGWPEAFLSLLDDLLEPDPGARPASAEQVLNRLVEVDAVIEKHRLRHENARRKRE